VQERKGDSELRSRSVQAEKLVEEEKDEEEKEKERCRREARSCLMVELEHKRGQKTKQRRRK
jgi:hypothetical protein